MLTREKVLKALEKGGVVIELEDHISRFLQREIAPLRAVIGACLMDNGGIISKRASQMEFELSLEESRIFYEAFTENLCKLIREVDSASFVLGMENLRRTRLRQLDEKEEPENPTNTGGDRGGDIGGIIH